MLVQRFCYTESILSPTWTLATFCIPRPEDCSALGGETSLQLLPNRTAAGTEKGMCHQDVFS